MTILPNSEKEMLAGVWLFFEMGEPAFLLYAGGYLIIGVITMLITALIPKIIYGKN